MIIFDKNQFINLLNSAIDYPSLDTKIYNDDEIFYIYKDFYNGFGCKTLFIHFETLFNAILNLKSRSSTHLSKYELYQIYPEYDIDNLNKIFNAININSKNIDIFEFIDFMTSKLSHRQLNDIMKCIKFTSKFEPESESEIIPEPEPELQVISVPEPLVIQEPEIEPELEVIQEPEIEPEQEVIQEPKIEPDPEVILEPKIEPEIEPDPEAIPELEIISEPEVWYIKLKKNLIKFIRFLFPFFF